ncbi:hypothetical protein WSM22_06600 [Cytophagales bacterium WSM2-2]|nr:hypothetical protein WSM22_06600 [Cytophagales bacterium WSM2-2]
MKRFLQLFLAVLLSATAAHGQWTFSSKFGSSGSGNGQFKIECAGIALSSSKLYVTDGGSNSGNNRVQVFNTSGVYQSSWGSIGTGNGQFNGLRGIAIDGSGNTYVTDEQNIRVQKFNSSGVFVTKWGTTGSGNGQFSFAYAIAVEPGGSFVYVADVINKNVQKFNSTGVYQSKISFTNQPLAIAVDNSNNLYAADGATIFKYNSSGVLQTSWASTAVNLTIASISGTQFLYSTGGNKLTKYALTGTQVQQQTFTAGTGNGQFNSAAPGSIAVDASENVYLCDVGNLRIQIFSPSPVISITNASNAVINSSGSFDWSVPVPRFSSGNSTFHIKNTGLANLTINTSSTITSGTNASDFTIDKSQLSSPIAPGQQTNFTVAFSPGAVGARTALLTVASDDPTTPTYTITLNAEGEKTEQIFTFPSSFIPKVGVSIPLAATSNSGLPVILYSMPDETNAHIDNNNTLVCVLAGPIQIRVRETQGNADYLTYDNTFDFNVAKGDQTITFGSLASKTFGDAAFNVSASSSVSLPVSFSSSNTSVATVSGNLVTIVGAGTTTITASQAGNSNYNAAANVQQTLTVQKISPVVSITSANSGNFQDIINLITNKGGSGGAVTYAVANNFNGTTGSASVDNATGKLTLSGTGQVQLTATVAGTANYNQAVTTQVITISKLTPTISFTSVNSGTYGNTINLTVNKGGSTGAITYSVVNNTGSGTLNGNVLSLTGAGSLTLKADVAADANYNAASSGNFSFTVNKANPAVSITSANTTVYGSTLQLTANTGGSTGAITYSVVNSGNGLGWGEVNGSAVFSPMSVGDLSIKLDVTADANYNSAQVTQAFTVTPKTITITGVSIADKAYDGTTTATITGTPALNGIVPGDNMTLNSTSATAIFSDKNAGSNKTVIVSGYLLGGGNVNPSYYTLIQPTLTANITKAPITISITGANTYNYDGAVKSITVATTPSSIATATTYNGSASAPANAGIYNVQVNVTDPNYQGSATATLTISKAVASVVLSGAGTFSYDGSKKIVTATTTPAGLSVAVTYNGSATEPVNAGSYNVQASVTNPNYEGSATATLTINKIPATVTLVGTGSFSYDGNKKPVSVSTTPAGLNVAITYNGNTAEPVNVGSYQVVGSITDVNYQGSANGTVTITKVNQTISFTAVANKTMGDAAFTLPASASSNLPFTYAITPSGRATITNNQLTLVSPGRVTITSSQSGDGNFNAAAPVSQSFCINPAKPVISANFSDPFAPVLTSSSSIGNQWFIGNTSIASAKGVSLNIDKEGSYTVQVTVDDCLSAVSNPFIVGITAVAKEQVTISYSPNPVNDYLHVNSSDNANISIVTLQGITLDLPAQKSAEGSVIDMRGVASGVYFLRVNSSQNANTYRIVKM